MLCNDLSTRANGAAFALGEEFRGYTLDFDNVGMCVVGWRHRNRVESEWVGNSDRMLLTTPCWKLCGLAEIMRGKISAAIMLYRGLCKNHSN